MRRILLILSALMIFSAGCGNAADTAENAKKEAESKAVAAVAKDGELIQGVEKKFALGGIVPLMTLGEVTEILGEPVEKHDDDEFIFANGLVVEITDVGNFIEEIKTRQAGVPTGLGVSVGMTEEKLIEIYGQADSVEKDDGEIEYKYFSEDKSVKIEFEVKKGKISEIKTKMN